MNKMIYIITARLFTFIIFLGGLYFIGRLAAITIVSDECVAYGNSPISTGVTFFNYSCTPIIRTLLTISFGWIGFLVLCILGIFCETFIQKSN